MKYGMPRKCDDELRSLVRGALLLLLLVAGLAGYGLWQVRQPSEGRRAEGGVLIARAVQLLEESAGMAADLKGMLAWGYGDEDVADVNFLVKATEMGSREEARRQKEKWEGSRGVERARARAVFEALGDDGGDGDSARQAWEELVGRVEQAKRELEGTLAGLFNGMWVPAKRYATDTEALCEALVEPERLWTLREEWADARALREKAFQDLRDLPKSERLVEETREELDAFLLASQQRVEKARQSLEASWAEREQGLAAAGRKIQEYVRNLDALQAKNTALVATAEEAGLQDILTEFEGHKNAYAKDKETCSEDLEKWVQAAEDAQEAVRRHRTFLQSRSICDEHVADDCKAAVASTNAFRDVAEALGWLVKGEAEARRDEKQSVEELAAKAQEIWEREFEKVPSAGMLSEMKTRLTQERNNLRNELARTKTEADQMKASVAAAGGAEAWKEYEEAFDAAGKGWPGDVPTLTDGNALAREKKINAERKNLVERAATFLNALEGRLSELEALKKTEEELQLRGRRLMEYETKLVAEGTTNTLEHIWAEWKAVHTLIGARQENLWGEALENGADWLGESEKDRDRARDFVRWVDTAEQNRWIGSVEWQYDVPDGIRTGTMTLYTEGRTVKGYRPGNGTRPFGLRFTVQMPDDKVHWVVIGVKKEKGWPFRNGAKIDKVLLSGTLRISDVQDKAELDVNKSAIIDWTPLVAIRVRGESGGWAECEFEGRFDDEDLLGNYFTFAIFLEDGKWTKRSNPSHKLLNLHHKERKNGPPISEWSLEGLSWGDPESATGVGVAPVGRGAKETVTWK